MGWPYTDDLWRWCARMHEAIELQFGVVSGVRLGNDVLDGVQMPLGQGVGNTGIYFSLLLSSFASS